MSPNDSWARLVVTPAEWETFVAQHEDWLDRNGVGDGQAHLEKRRLTSDLNMRGRRLDKAIFRFCDLTDLDLSETQLNGADLSGSTLTNTVFSNNRNLDGLWLVGSRVEGAKFNGAKLTQLHADGATFRKTDFTNANLTEADLRRTVWHRSILRGAKLTQADLREADLRYVGDNSFKNMVRCWFWPETQPPFLLDDTFIRQARFSARSQDPWSVLRRTYTGPRLIFVLILTLAALGPMLVQASLLRGIGQAERLALPAAVSAVRKTAEALKRSLPPAGSITDERMLEKTKEARIWLNKADSLLAVVDLAGPWWARDRINTEHLRELIDTLEESERWALETLENARAAAERRVDRAATLSVDPQASRDTVSRVRLALNLLNALFPDNRLRVHAVPVWAILLQWHRGRWPAIMTGLLLIYNLLRFLITYFIAPTRDEEERSDYAPPLASYQMFYQYAHRACCLLGWVSLVCGTWQFVQGMQVEILIPH